VINAEQITARLRMMSDTDLQRFAEMNKQDPYLFPLAFNESNIRKKVRAAGAAQQAAPPAPVNEQAVAAMTPQRLPEHQGIGMLNPNLQFADGGLVAFASGGSPEDEYEANDDMYSGEMPTYADGGTTEAWPSNAFAPPRRLHWTAPNPLLTTPLVGEESLRKLPYIRDTQTAADAQKLQADEKEPWPESTNTRPTPKQTSLVPENLPAPVSRPAPVMPMASPGQFSTASNIRKLYSGAAADEQKIAEQRVADYMRDRPAPETFEEQKALLQESAADAEKQQRMDEGLAWLTFASKVMTPGMNPIQALVEGAAAGTSQYAAAQKDLKKAERERKMGLASLAQAERAAKRQDYDAVEQFKLKAVESADRARQAGVDATARAYGTDATIAGQMYDSALNRAASAANVNAQIAAQERIANLGVTRAEMQSRAQAARDLDKEARDIWTDPAKRMGLPPNIKTIDDLRVYLQGVSGSPTSARSLSGFEQPILLSPPPQPTR
jgi:hypothetical protein